jgi:DNA polymerase-1
LPKSFYIIDGHYQIFRAYFAPFRDLQSPSGEPTKATFVFTQALMSLIENRKPDYLAMVIDSGDASVFRVAIDPQYKANRESPPEDFHPQMERILQIVRTAGVQLYAKSGFEADDLMATMSRRLSEIGDFDVVLVSKDKDLRQVLRPGVRMYDLQADKFTDAESMQRDLGYSPAQAIEIQTLTGDSTDNIKGIPGVGPKTAVKLIQQYGTAEAVYDHLDDLTPKLRENFEKSRDVLPISRKLVTLDQNVEFGFDPESCKFGGPDVPALSPMLQSLGFVHLLSRFGTPAHQPPKPAPTKPKPVATKPPPPPPPNPAGHFEESLFAGMAGMPAESIPTDDASSLAPEASSAASVEPVNTELFDAGAGVVAGPPPLTSESADYRAVRTEADLAAFIAELSAQSRFAFDTETDALGAMRSNLVGMSFSWKDGTGWYIPVRAPVGQAVLDPSLVLSKLATFLENPRIGKIGHNIKYDILAMRVAGVNVRGVVMDTMVAAFLLEPGRLTFGIDRLALDLLNFRKIPTSELIGKGKNQSSMDRVDVARVARYAAEDVDIAWRLANLLSPRLDAIPPLRQLHDTLETPLVDVLADMEANGIAVDPSILKQQSVVLGERIDLLRTRIHEAAAGPFNIDSPKQLGDVLFTRLKLKSVKSTKTGQSTDVEVLERLSDQHPVPKLVLEYRSLVKLKNTYLDNLTDFVNPRTGRIHASFNQTGAATGRLSCSDPNLQNIPIRTDEGRRIRLAFVPGDPVKNVLLTADYSQIELRLLAHLCREPALLRAFEADQDIHAAVAAEVFGVAVADVSKDQRAQAKIINFGIIYGVSASGLARRIDGMNVAAAQSLINAYDKRFPAVKQFMDQCVVLARTQGFVETILGRRRPIPEVNSGTLSIRRMGERMAINSVVQGSAADLIKVAMLNIHRAILKDNRPSKLLVQVHDELVFETPAEFAEAESEFIRREMAGAMSLSVPLRVSLGSGHNWQEVK